MEKGKTQVLNKEETSNDFEEDEIKDKFGVKEKKEIL